jgi:ATP-dependent helicase/nuclease subunit A
LLVHDALARIDFGDSAAIATWCEHLAPLYVVENAEQAARSACQLIERFVQSSGEQLAQAATLHREIDFLLAWPPGQTNGDGVYIQGTIDCLYQGGDGRWRLADYKTNDVSADAVPSLASRYALQLYVYAIAAERALGQPVEELVLHFLRPGVTHVLPWNDTARRQAMEMVNEAIETQRGVKSVAGGG